MTAPSLLSLGERVEKAMGPSDSLDEDIAVATGWAHRSGKEWRLVVPWEQPRFTASLDAAMTLVPEGMLAVVANSGSLGPKPNLARASAAVGLPDETMIDGPIEAVTPALALCAAALKARASMV